MKIKYLFLVLIMFFMMGASCQKKDDLVSETDLPTLSQDCSTPAQCFEQCVQLTDGEACYIDFFNKYTESVCLDLSKADFCEDFYKWNRALSDKDCLEIDTSLWRNRCLEAFGDTQTLFDEADFDGDGLSNLKEMELGTDFRRADTDGDGISDYDEIRLGTDPLTAN